MRAYSRLNDKYRSIIIAYVKLLNVKLGQEIDNIRCGDVKWININSVARKLSPLF